MVFRVNKTGNYTVMSNQHFKEKNMSLKAKGLLSLMLSLPNNWDYSIAGLATLSSDGETSIRSALKELEDFKYLVRRRIYENGKIVDWEYNIFEFPTSSLDVENQQLENLIQENKDNKILNKQNTKQTNKKTNNKLLVEETSTSNFLNSAKKSKKESMYTKCVHMIDAFTNNTQLRIDLTDYLQLLLEMRKDEYILYANTFKGILNKLASITDDVNEQCKIVRQSIERGYKSVFPISNYKYTRNKDDRTVFGEGKTGEVMCDQYTDDELEELKRLNEERERQGLQTKF